MNFPLGFGSGAIGLKSSLLSCGVEGPRCVAAFGPDSPVTLFSSTAASLASLEAIKARVTELHLEQLLQRERPIGRSAEGWQNILSTAQRTLEAHLATLDTPAQVWDFAHRCLKDSLLKDAFRFFAVDDVCAEAISEDLVKETVFATEERPLFEQDLEAFDFSTSAASSGAAFPDLQASPSQPIDLSPRLSFGTNLCSSSCKAVIDID